MSENTKIQGSVVSDVVAGQGIDAGLARRRLIRAGLAAAPVMLGLKTQSALAYGSSGGHCKPSVWSSLKGAKGCHSSHSVDHGGNTCHHHSDWALSNHSECGKKYHQHSSNFHVPFAGSDCTQVGKPVPTLKEVCKGYYGSNSGNLVTSGDTKKDLLAKHCAAMYLNIKVDNKCPIDEPTVHNIWNNCKNNGVWTPPSGGNSWSRDDCIEYFEYVCKGTKPSSWGNTCA
jgi:hypothetical protein